MSVCLHTKIRCFNTAVWSEADFISAEKVDGVYQQKLTIYYNCVDSVEIPDVLPLSQPEILLNTRKGVAVNYSQSEKAANQ